MCQAPNAFICVSGVAPLLPNTKCVHMCVTKSGVILAYMCVKLLVRLCVCHRVGPFWVHSGSILGPFWVHSSADVQMDTPLEAHLDFLWRQLPEGLCGRKGAHDTPATRTRATTFHIRCPKLQSPNVNMYPRTTAGTPHVNYQLLQAVFPRLHRLGNHIQLQVRRRSPGYSKDISSASPQRRKRAHK